jgi:hypothetical protein
MQLAVIDWHELTSQSQMYFSDLLLIIFTERLAGSPLCQFSSMIACYMLIFLSRPGRQHIGNNEAPVIAIIRESRDSFHPVKAATSQVFTAGKLMGANGCEIPLGTAISVR